MTAVIGLDLSLSATGLATASGVQTIKSTGRTGDGLRARRDRLDRLSAAVCNAVDMASGAGGSWQVALIVIEAPAFDSRTGHQHDRSGLWWLIVDELIRVGHHVTEVTTGGLKKYATGVGNAKKAAVVSAVSKRFGVEFGDDNQADAFVLRAMGCDWLGEPILSMPKSHRAALEAVRWPTGRGAP